jgi:hypothetical protein
MELARPINLECDGMFVNLVDVPTSLSTGQEEELRRLQLQQAKSIEVWPAGLAAVAWDGEGRGEWLASERPCLAIRSDHPVSAIRVSIGSAYTEILELAPIVPGEPVFIELPLLPLGLHTVQLSVRGIDDVDPEPLGDLDVVIRIREARSWSTGVNPHSPLDLMLDPSTPTLEDLWEDKVAVVLRGPRGRSVKCHVSLFEGQCDVPLVKRWLPPLELPVFPTAWRAHFEKQFLNLSAARDGYDRARACELAFHAEELGEISLSCERSFTPLRWAVRRDGQHFVVRLLNDSGLVDEPVISHTSYETPCREQPLGVEPEYVAPLSGGMYVATLGDLSAAVIVQAKISGLTDLRCLPQFDEQARGAPAVHYAIRMASLWNKARLPGDIISVKRRRDVLDAIIAHVLCLIGGSQWANAESAFRDGNDDLTRLSAAVSRRREEAALGVVLVRDYRSLAVATCQERVIRLAQLGERFLSLSSPANAIGASQSFNSGVTHSPASDSVWLAECALRLASDIGGLPPWAGELVGRGITQLLEKVPVLARAARFLVLAIDQHFESNASPGELYAGWRWE